MAEFIMNKPDNRVEYDLWYTSSNDKALDFIQDFAEYDSKFGEKVLMEPRFVFWTCKDCEDKYLSKDCYGAGSYCAYESSNENLSGREIIQEDLREKCLYRETYKEAKTRHYFWSYMKEVHVNCYNVINRECSKNAHKKLGLDFSKTEKCVNDSFSGSDWGSSRTKNYIIEEEIAYMKEYGTYF